MIDLNSVLDVIAKRRDRNPRAGREQFQIAKAFMPNDNGNLAIEKAFMPNNNGNLASVMENALSKQPETVTIDETIKPATKVETRPLLPMPDRPEVVTQTTEVQPENPVVAEKYQRMQEYAQKDFSKRKNPDFDPSLPESDTNKKYIIGKDRDTKRDWKDILKSIGLAAAQGVANNKGNSLESVLGAALGGAATGGIAGAIDPNTDDRWMNDIKLAKATQEYEKAYGVEKGKTEEAKRQAELDILRQKPDWQRREQDRKEWKDLIDAEYKRNLTIIGKEKADEIKANNQRIYDLRLRGVDQNDERIKILRDRNEELKRHNRVTEEQAVTREQNISERQRIGIDARKDAADARKNAEAFIIKLRDRLANERDMKKDERKRLEKQIKDVELEMQATGSAMPTRQ